MHRYNKRRSALTGPHWGYSRIQSCWQKSYSYRLSAWWRFVQWQYMEWEAIEVFWFKSIHIYIASKNGGGWEDHQHNGKYSFTIVGACGMLMYLVISVLNIHHTFTEDKICHHHAQGILGFWSWGARQTILWILDSNGVVEIHGPFKYLCNKEVHFTIVSF